MSNADQRSIRRWKLAGALVLLLIAAALLWWQRGDLPFNSNTRGGEPAPGPSYVGKYRFLALGDSYTIGEQVSPGDRWPVQLATRLRAKGVDIGDPIIVARTGWTTGDLLAAIDEARPRHDFDLVMLLIGVNNQYQGLRTDDYRKEFVTLLERSTALAGNRPAHVVVLSIPDWGAMPFAVGADVKQIGAAIDQFNAINREETTKSAIAYIDITAISREATSQPDLVAPDDLHPSGRQYARWVAACEDAAMRAIRN